MDFERVVHVASGDLWGGAESLISALVREQAIQLRQPPVCVLLNNGRLASELITAGIDTIVIDESKFGAGTIVARMRSIFQNTRANVIHAHRQKENVFAAVAAKLGTKNANPKLITTVHGAPEPIAKGRSLKNRMTLKLNTFVLSRIFDATVAVSKDLHDRLSGQIPAHKLFCVPNGIQLIRSQNKSSNETSKLIARRPLRLLSMGRLVPVKRFERLAQLKIALEESSQLRATITLAGDGPLRSSLQHTFTNSSAAPLVHMLGHVDMTETLLDQTDALVITSDHEGLPMVALEALRRGIPVFGFQVGGLPELTADNAPVRLVAPGDITALASAIERFFTLERLEPWQPSPEWAFSMSRCAATYIDLYRRLCVHTVL